MTDIDYNKAINFWSNFVLIAGILAGLGAIASGIGAHFLKRNTSLQAGLIQNENDDKLEKLSYPLPNEFIITNITLILGVDNLKEFLPDLRKQIEQEKNIFKNYDENMNVIKRGVSISNVNGNGKLLSLFENKEIYWKMYIRADENQISQGSTKNLLLWIYRDKLSLTDRKCRLSYEVDYTNGTREYFKVTMDKSNLNNSNFENTITYYPNKITSLKELCNKTVSMSISAGPVKNGPNIYFENISFRDNHSRTFRLEFISHYETISKTNMDFMAKTIARINNEMADKTDDPKTKKALLSMADNSLNLDTPQVDCLGKFNCLSMPKN